MRATAAPRRDRSFVLLVVLTVVMLACGEAPPAIDTTTAAAAPAALPATDGQALPTPAAPAAAAPPAVPGPVDGPQVVALDPPPGATDVDPARTTLTVTFDRAMDPEGWAWVTVSAETAPEIGESRWDDAVRVHTAEVRLAPGRTYEVWLNSPQYSYFRDREGRALAPLQWTFTTAAADATAPTPARGVDPVAAH
jgi:RNA polymerase sigma-70 factor (ECF subfamily)